MTFFWSRLLWTSVDCRFVSLARVFIERLITGATGIDNFLIFQMCASLLYVEFVRTFRFPEPFDTISRFVRKGEFILILIRTGTPAKLNSTMNDPLRLPIWSLPTQSPVMVLPFPSLSECR